MATEKRIILKSYTNVRNEFITAVDTLNAGDICSLDSTGKLVQGSTATGDPLFGLVVEDELQGKDASPIEYYETGVKCIVWKPTKGDEGLLLVVGATITRGDLLTTAVTTGRPVAATIGTHHVIAVALETITASSGESKYIHVMFM